MQQFFLNNIQWIILSTIGFIVWLIRLEGVVKANNKAAEVKAAAIIAQMEAELKSRDANIKAVADEAAHLTRMGENIKDTLNPLLQRVAGLDAKVDILLERTNQKN